MMGSFGIIENTAVREGLYTNIYFLRTWEIFRKKTRPLVTMEVISTSEEIVNALVIGFAPKSLRSRIPYAKRQICNETSL